MRSFLNVVTDLGVDFPKYCLWLGLSMLVGTVALLTSGSWRDRIREYGQRGGILSILGDISSGVLRTLVGLGVIAFLSAHLITESRRFASQHGRVTEANLSSVQRIWGYPHAQRELAVQHFVETTEETEESFTDDESGRKRTKKTKTKVRNQVEQNSIVGSDVSVKIRMNYRRKGSAYYTCFEDECQFRYDVQNVSEKATEAEFRFPLPSSEGLFDSVKITVDGRELGPRLSYKSSRIGWTMPMQPGQKATVEMGYHSRGMDYFYYQVPEPREIRNFRLRMELADVQDLNYPEGCMTPMKITKNGKGSVLEWHLDRAITTRGMGVALPSKPQPGYYVAQLLRESPLGLWLLMAMLVISRLYLGKRVELVPLALIGAAYFLFYALLSRLSDFGDPLAGFIIGFVMAFVLLALLVNELLTRWEPKSFATASAIGLFVFFTLVFPLIVILDGTTGTLMTCVYVGLWCYVAVLAVRQRASQSAAAV